MFLGAISFFVKIASFFQSDIRGRESLHCFAKSSWEIFCSVRHSEIISRNTLRKNCFCSKMFLFEISSIPISNIFSFFENACNQEGGSFVVGDTFKSKRTAFAVLC